jgi:hypothetical protein
MPNQPKTPARTFRLSDETIQKVDEMGAALATTNRSESLRKAVDSMHALSKAFGLPEGISLDAAAAAEEAGISQAAMNAADDASWLNVRMPSQEANRRLLKALSAAQPFMTATARADERQRTLRDVITRLEGMQVDERALDHLKSLLD